MVICSGSPGEASTKGLRESPRNAGWSKDTEKEKYGALRVSILVCLKHKDPERELAF